MDPIEGRPPPDHQPLQAWRYIAVAAAILFLHALVLHLMGRIPWCKCGFALWTSHAWSSDTSQDLADPYSFTHVIHDIFFYWVLATIRDNLTLNVLMLLHPIPALKQWQLGH